jgi:hypothetical protein
LTSAADTRSHCQSSPAFPVNLPLHLDTAGWRLISPIYWVTDASEGDVISKRERKLGYTLAATHECAAG